MSDNVTVEDQDLDYTQRVRRQLVESMIEKGEMPEDPKDRMTLLHALDGMDRQALGKKRIDVDKEVGNKQVQAAGILAELFRDPRAGKVGLGERQDIPTFDHDIAPTRVLPGELATGTVNDSYDAFQQRQALPATPSGAAQ